MNEAQRYERFVGSLYRRLLVSATGSTQPDEIHHRSRYRGSRTQNMHEVDLSYRVTRRQRSILILVECKCYRRRVEKAVVEQRHAKMGDIKARGGIVVTTRGFQKGAIGAAKAYGIALFVAKLRSPFVRLSSARPLPARFEIVLDSRGRRVSPLATEQARQSQGRC